MSCSHSERVRTSSSTTTCSDGSTSGAGAADDASPGSTGTHRPPWSLAGMRFGIRPNSVPKELGAGWRTELSQNAGIAVVVSGGERHNVKVRTKSPQNHLAGSVHDANSHPSLRAPMAASIKSFALSSSLSPCREVPYESDADESDYDDNLTPTRTTSTRRCDRYIAIDHSKMLGCVTTPPPLV